MLNKIKQLKKNKKGFTLIELVVVLVIIAILAAITVPVVTGYIEDANDARYVSEARAIYLVVQAEESKATAQGKKTDETFYKEVVTTANKKVKDTADGGKSITVASITAPVKDSPNPADDTSVYTIVFASGDGKVITSEIEPNKEIKITNKEAAAS